MSWYNTTGLNGQSGLLPLVNTIGDNNGSLFAGAMLMFIFLIILMRFRSSGNQDAFLGSSFITSIIAGLMFGIGILQAWFLVIPISLFIISLLVKVWGEG